MIDQQLKDSEWEADTQRLRHSEGIRPAKGHNMAIAEWPTANGPADYALFVDLTLVELDPERLCISVLAELAAPVSERAA